MDLNRQLHFNSHMGRMGNQMFQYACAKNLELRHGFTCSLDDLSKLSYFRLAKGERWKNWLKAKFFFHVVRRLKGMRIYNLQFDDMYADYREWLQSIGEPTMIWAYFQSEGYFEESAVAIKSFFKIKESFRQNYHSFLQRHGLQEGDYNAVHLRRTDYKGFTVKGLQGDDFTLPETYYESVLQWMPDQERLIIVSDDPEYCRNRFSEMNHVTISEEDAITDFQLLSGAAKLAISNSTFAWWAAWLNPHATEIFCPKYFLGFREQKEVPLNIYPASWKQISVLPL